MYRDDLHEVPDFIGDKLSNIGLIRVSDTKTKFDSVRVYMSFGAHQLSDILPLSLVYRYVSAETYYKMNSSKILRMRLPSSINWVLIPYQSFVYRQVYKMAIRKYPQYRDNILNGADHSELLEKL